LRTVFDIGILFPVLFKFGRTLFNSSMVLGHLSGFQFVFLDSFLEINEVRLLIQV
jgi:hypothetical protein